MYLGSTATLLRHNFPFSPLLPTSLLLYSVPLSIRTWSFLWIRYPFTLFFVCATGWILDSKVDTEKILCGGLHWIELNCTYHGWTVDLKEERKS